MRSLIFICAVLAFVDIIGVSYARPQSLEPTYKINPDGSISGGFSTASIMNEAGGGLALGTGYSVTTNFSKKPGQANISKTSKQTSLNVAYHNRIKDEFKDQLNQAKVYKGLG